MSEGVKACLWDRVVGDRLCTGGLPCRKSATMLRSYRGLMAGIGQVHLVTLGHIPWEEAPPGCMGLPPLLTPTSQPTAQPASPLNMALFTRGWEMELSFLLPPTSRNARCVSCLSDPKECLLHMEMHPAPIHTFTWVLCLFGRGSQSREALCVQVKMQSPEPLPHFLGQISGISGQRMGILTTCPRWSSWRKVLYGPAWKPNPDV